MERVVLIVWRQSKYGLYGNAPFFMPDF